MTEALHDRALGALARLTSRFLPWYRLPFPLALATLAGHRVNMRRNNLFSTERDPALLEPRAGVPRDQREADGSFNDLSCPWMGMAGARFGRNAPIAATFGEAAPDLYTPNPRRVSRELLARREFVPVPYLNLLAVGWLQFVVHGWGSHGPNDAAAPPHCIPLSEDDDWPGDHMTVLRTMPDRKRSPADAAQPATYRNTESHWWDGSQIYGSSRARQFAVRSDPSTGTLRQDGKLHLGRDGRLPLEPHARHGHLELSGMNGNWWAGLSVMHTLFAREHNTIVDRLRLDHPGADGEWLFQKARLVNAALIAKIHTTEWTPALMNSPEGRFGMRSNWWGALGEHYSRVFGRFGDGDILSGIVGSTAEHHGAPYAMTDEFVAAYRMHSLLPDRVSFRRHGDDVEITDRDLRALVAGGTHSLYAHVAFDDVVYSLATSNPGALVLHNYPAALRRLNKKHLPPAEPIVVDLAAIDVLRDRERGVPRYCAMRRHLGISVPESFEELTDNPQWQQELRSVYGTVDKVDFLVGTLAERAPPGFGFSDTAFRIFILMASRRLKSDRFFTADFTPEVYTPAGFAWIEHNSLRSVVARHFPVLQAHFADIRNLFFPWDKGGA